MTCQSFWPWSTASAATPASAGTRAYRALADTPGSLVSRVLADFPAIRVSPDSRETPDFQVSAAFQEFLVSQAIQESVVFPAPQDLADIRAPAVSLARAAFLATQENPASLEILDFRGSLDFLELVDIRAIPA